MNINDINYRLRRIYHSLSQKYEPDIQANIKVDVQREGHKGSVSITFGKSDDVELNNKIFNIIAAISGLKDHLKNKLIELNRNPQDVEALINKNLNLQIITDLWNEDKHGYPLKLKSRSNLDPKIVDVKQALTIKDISKGSGSVAFRITANNLESPTATETDNVIINISGYIVDKNEKKLMSLEDLFNGAISEYEKFIQTNGLA